jgi:peptidoglycan hydrolase CwlO-like protein
LNKILLRMIGVLLAAALLSTTPALAGAAATPQPGNSTSLTQAQAAANNLQNEIDGLNGQLKEAEGRFTSAQQQLAQLRASIEANRQRQVKTSASLTQAQESLSESVVALYETSPGAALEAIFSAQSLTQVVDRIKSLDDIGSQRSTIVADVTATKKELANRQETLAIQEKQATDLVEQIAQQKDQIQQTTQARQKELSQANASVVQIMRQIAAAKAKAAAEAAQRAAEAAKQAAGKAAQGGSSGEYTPESWARTLLSRCGLPVTSQNVKAIVAWEMAEGGNWANSAHYNPLNTTMSEPGATSINSVGVKAYTSWDQGFDATIATLNNGCYGVIISALKAGNNAQAVADAVGASPWGTSPFTV